MKNQVTFLQLLGRAALTGYSLYLCGKVLYTYVQLFFTQNEKFGVMEGELQLMALLLLWFVIPWFIDSCKKFVKRVAKKRQQREEY